MPYKDHIPPFMMEAPIIWARERAVSLSQNLFKAVPEITGLNCLMPHECFRSAASTIYLTRRLSNAENELRERTARPSSRSRPGAATPSTGLRELWRSTGALSEPQGCPRVVMSIRTWFRSACRRPGGMRFKRGETCPPPPDPSIEERPGSRRAPRGGVARSDIERGRSSCATRICMEAGRDGRRSL